MTLCVDDDVEHDQANYEYHLEAANAVFNLPINPDSEEIDDQDDCQENGDPDGGIDVFGGPLECRFRVVDTGKVVCIEREGKQLCNSI